MRLSIAVVPCAAIVLGWICIMFGKAGDYTVQGKTNTESTVSAKESVRDN